MKKKSYTILLALLALILLPAVMLFTSPIIPSYAQGGYGYEGGAGGGGSASIPPGFVSLVGVTDANGVVTTTTPVNSSDGKAGLTINTGTKVLDKYGSRLSSIMIIPVEPPTAIPANAKRVGFVYDLSPDGATFSPPVAITFKYNPADIPAGNVEANLVLAYFNAADGKWEMLPSIIDTANKTVSASISHNSKYALFAQAVSAPPAPPTPPPTTPAPTPPKPTPPTTPAPTPPTTPAPKPPTTPAPAPTPTPTPLPGWLWPTVGAVAVIVIAVVVWLVIRRRTAY